MKFFQRVVATLVNKFNENFYQVGIEFQRRVKVFGIIFFINYPLYYLIWKYGSVQSYENLPLRISASLLCLPLIFNQWKGKFPNFLRIYWYFSVIYCLPFFFLYMTLNNHGSAAWLLNLLLQIFLTFLLFELLEVIIVNIVGFGSALIIYSLLENKVIIFAPSTIDVTGALSTIVATFVVGGIFVYSNEKINKEKLNAMAGVAASIAHELRTPLATINFGSRNLKKYFSIFIEAYKEALRLNIQVQHIKPTVLQMVEKIPSNMESETESAALFIDMLLMNLKPQIGVDKVEEFSAKNCLENSLARYPFSDEQEILIKVNTKEDFLIRGKELLVTHILFNLLKNALYYIAATGKGNIEIWFEKGTVNNLICFKDTGPGISKEHLPHIFDKFFTKTRHGAGIGLAFCRSAMESMDGTITCESIELVYTKFVLTFPNVEIKKYN